MRALPARLEATGARAVKLAEAQGLCVLSWEEGPTVDTVRRWGVDEPPMRPEEPLEARRIRWWTSHEEEARTGIARIVLARNLDVLRYSIAWERLLRTRLSPEGTPPPTAFAIASRGLVLPGGDDADALRRHGYGYVLAF